MLQRLTRFLRVRLDASRESWRAYRRRIDIENYLVDREVMQRRRLAQMTDDELVRLARLGASPQAFYAELYSRGLKLPGAAES